MDCISVSVVIPVYNAEKYLSDCLDSVISQTLRNIEIICVDDGSSDGSMNILQSYAEKDSRIRIITQSNKGAGLARNRGLEAAHGKYLAFLDADDLYYPEVLESAYIKAEHCGADIVIFEADYFDMDSGFCWKEEINTGIVDGLKVFSASAVPDVILQIASCNTWNKLYLRDFIAEYDLQYQGIKTANDLCFVYSAIALAKRITVLSQPLIRHRVLHSGNLQSVKKKTPMDFFEALLLLRDNLQKFGLWEQLRQSYVNCALFHCIYNWETLDNKSRKRVKCREHDVFELLELGLHPESYYYDRNKYLKINKILFEDRNGGAGIMGAIKNMLKRFLPPPVNSFNREIDGLRQYMQEIRSSNERWQKILLKKIDSLEAKQSAITEKLTRIEKEYADLKKSIENINKPIIRNYEFYEKLSPDKYASEIALRYKAKTGEELHLRSPWTYNEKIQWLKLYDSTPIKTRLTDKYLVREWIKEKIGEEFLIPLLGVWNSFDEIDFDTLPDRFVLKANHGCGWNIFVNNKDDFDKADAKKKFDKWMKINYAFYNLELQYMNIKPKIIAEQYMDGLDRFDYKFMCFGGEVKFLKANSNRFTDLRTSLMTTDWKPIDAIIEDSAPDFEIPKPKSFEKMLEIATVLCQGFAHVRVDLYDVNGHVYFGEMTFTNTNGLAHIMPEQFNEQMGKWIKLPPKSPIPQRLQETE